MIFIDKWGFKALIDKKESKHHDIEDFFSKNWESTIFCKSDYVLDEIITLISYRLDYNKLLKFLDKIEESISIEKLRILWITREHFFESIALKKKYSDKLKISFTDFTTMSVMLKNGIKDILTEDKHFIEVNLGFNVLFQ